MGNKFSTRTIWHIGTFEKADALESKEVLLEWKEVQDQNNVIISPNTQINKLRTKSITKIPAVSVKGIPAADALEAKEVPANAYVVIRYWYPFTEEAVQQPL
uniref:Ferrochelatase-2, chloroplastic-like n=1 Tax=Tanacetum cinerariifolium TaxID=118510 RepID=A0A699JVF5_TANCI|nr:ferrochelatase-2, chloroplastic-like [Tanacetum cinerariifolium]